MSPRSRHNGEGSIYEQRPGLWAAYVWVERPDGTRDRQYVYGKDRDVVHAKWVKLQQQATAGPIANKVPTVASYLTEWLEEVVKPNCAPLTYTTYEIFVRRYIVPGLGAKRLDKLQLRDVQTWINGIPKVCQCCIQGKDAKRPDAKRRCCARPTPRCCNDHPSASTLGDIRKVLQSALSHAVLEELVTRNVATLVKLPAVRKPKRKSWTSEEARRFLVAAREANDPMYAAYVLVLILGLRRGEVLGLTWNDVDLERGTLNIALQLQRVSGQLLHRETKTETSDGELPLPDICVTALRIRQVIQQETQQKAGSKWHKTDLIFTTRYGTPIEPRNFNRSFDNRGAHAGVRDITVHDARRTCGSLLADLDVHPRVAMQILRHAKFSITMEIYTQVSSEQTRAALKKLGDSLDGPGGETVK